MTTTGSTPRTAPAPREEADSIGDLLEDCREITGVLGSFVPAARPADHRGAMPVDITDAAVLNLVGYDDYGS